MTALAVALSEPTRSTAPPVRISWDVRKAEINAAKHSVAFDEAATAFGDPLGRIVRDPRHSIGEERFVLLGASSRGRLLAVMFTERVPDSVRIVSARLATRHERRDYEEDP